MIKDNHGLIFQENSEVGKEKAVVPETKYNFSYFCPAYDEEDNLPLLIEKVVKVLKEISDLFEIIIIDNGSQDRTLEIAQGLSRRFSQVRVCHFDKNMGYGGALEFGFKNSKYDYIIYTDADLQYDVSDVKRMIPFLNEYDIVSGLRSERADSSFRKFQSSIFNGLTNFLFRLKVKDINSSFKIFRKKVIDTIDMDILSKKGFFIDAEILIKAKRVGFKIKEVAIGHYPRHAGEAVDTLIKPQLFLNIALTLFHMFKLFISTNLFFKSTQKRK